MSTSRLHAHQVQILNRLEEYRKGKFNMRAAEFNHFFKGVAIMVGGGRVHRQNSTLGSYARIDCNQCQGYAPGYMLKTPIWNQARRSADGTKHDFLCLKCVSLNLERPVTYSDFTDAPINNGIFGFDKRKL